MALTANDISGDGMIDHKIFFIDSNEEVVCYFKDSGTDVYASKYFGLGRKAVKLAIRPSNAATITQINGKVLTQPLVLSAAWNSFSQGMISFDKIILRADKDSTKFEVLAF